MRHIQSHMNREQHMRQLSNAENGARSYRMSWLIAIAAILSAQSVTARADDSADENSALSNLNSTTWVQTSEEYHVLALGSYNQARRMLDIARLQLNWTAIPGQTLTDKNGKPLPLAVILDVDETVLDNSPYAAWLLKNKKSYEPETWNKWVVAEKAAAIPGAVDFVHYARLKNVKVFFITNRDFMGKTEVGKDSEKLKQHTVQNLKKANLLPKKETGHDQCVFLNDRLSQDESVMMRGEVYKSDVKTNWGSDKTSRRNLIAKCYRIVLLLGDVLGDFIGYEKDGKYLDFYKEANTKLNPTQRRAALKVYEKRWGRTWILLPNPGYGSWERAHYDFARGLSAEKMGKKKIEALNVWVN